MPSVDPDIPEEIPFATFDSMPYLKSPPIVPDVSQYTIFLLPSQVLTSGRYWVSVQANLDSSPTVGSNNWIWLNFGELPIGSSAVFENPDNGFGIDAFTWTPLLELPVPQPPNQMFALFGEKAFSPPCLHPMTQVMTSNGQKQIKEINAGDYVFDHKGSPVKVVYNIVLGPKTNKFVKVPANSLKKGLPPRSFDT